MTQTASIFNRRSTRDFVKANLVTTFAILLAVLATLVLLVLHGNAGS